MLERLTRFFRHPKSELTGRDAGLVCPWPLSAPGADLVLLLVVIALLLFGLLMVYSSSFIYAQERTGDGFAFIKKQLLFAGLGLGAMAVVARIDYRRWAKLAYPLLVLAMVTLIFILIPGIGQRVGGAKRWLSLGGLRFQPGEFAKFAVIVFAANQLNRKQDRLHTLTAGVLSSFLIPLPAFFLLLLEPDFGTTAMIILVLLTLIFIAGVPLRYLAVTLAPIGLAAVALVVRSGYRQNRMLSFFNPWSDPSGKGFQIIQSFVGLHNGSFWGVGLGNGKEKLFFLPEAHNDFILAVVGEELGFIGVAAVVLAFVYLVYRGLRIAWECKRKYQDLFGMLLAAGITLALGFQAFVNISVVLGLVPTKGLNLPFISYGGSALLIDLVAVGVLLSISRGPLRGRAVEKTN